MEIARRSFLTGLASLIAAPAIVRVASIMPVGAPKLIHPPIFEGMIGEYHGTIIRTYGMTDMFRAGLVDLYPEFTRLPAWLSE